MTTLAVHSLMIPFIILLMFIEFMIIKSYTSIGYYAKVSHFSNRFSPQTTVKQDFLTWLNLILCEWSASAQDGCPEIYRP